ncbi:M56 family metallopeptidase [uncultured Croceitalea sp.]|uniref:M56 family metallopeptidase n=1 Tax=uncultured Croceitalea sp. TaxID=1798908 RepID=UPI00374EC440
MLIYLLKSAACMAIFLLFYKLLLEKENMHIFKRFYLMLALVASFVIPNLVFIEYVEPVLTTNSNTNTFIQTSTLTVTETPARDIDVINWSLIAWSIYSIGFVIFGIRFLKNLFQILNRIRRNTKVKQGFNIRVLLLEQLPPHTFFKYIFLNKEKFETNTIPKEVLLHEEVHAKQRHSLDVVFIELLQVILWFNPLLYFFKKCIKLNHEFLADSAVIKKTISPSNYQNTLLSYLSQDSLEKYQSVKMANAINYSSIKKRFKVMKTQTSKKAILLRTLLILPLLAAMLYGFSETETKVVEKVNLKEELGKINPLQINYPEGATEKMMFEYKSFIEEYQETNNIKYDKYQRAIAIYGIMTKVQKKSVKKYPEFPFFNKVPEITTLDNSKLEAYKDKQKFAIWVDGKVIDNKLLNDYTVSDFVYHSESFVYNNARSKRFPQEYQVSLYTKRGFENTFNKKEASHKELARYNVLAEKYNAIPIEKRIIPLKDLKALEIIYKKMTSAQRENAQQFPECLPKKNEKREFILLIDQSTIYLNGKKVPLRSFTKEVDELTKNWEETDYTSIPTQANFSSTPLAFLEKVEKEFKKTHFSKSNEGMKIFPHSYKEKLSQKGASRTQMKTYNVLAKKYNEMPLDNMRISIQDVEQLKYIYSIMSDKQKEDAEPFPDFPEPPSVPNYLNTPSPTNSIKALKGGASTIPKPPNPKVGNDKVSSIPTPPLPPEPIEPLDHIIAMAKEGAVFFFEGEEISSDKAIELFKNSNNLNISTSKSSSKKPQVRITKQPVKTGRIRERKLPLNNDTIKKSNTINGVLVNQKSYTNFDNPLVKNTFVKNSNTSHYISTENKVKKIELAFPEKSKYKKPTSIAKSHNLLSYTKELANKNALFYYDNVLVTADTGLSILASKKYASVETSPYTSKRSEVRIYTNK